MNLHFEEIGPANWREDIHVNEEQKHYVSDVNRTLARAFAYRNHGSKAYMICNEEQYIGIVMYYELEDMNAYELSQFFIDERYQAKGYGKAACKMILDKMREEGKFSKVILCYIDGNDAAKNLYLDLGFTLTGESDGDEIVMSLNLQI